MSALLPIATAKADLRKEAAYFDLATVNSLREILDEAWSYLPPEQQATMLKSTLAERILKPAAKGERNRERLLDVAHRDLVA